MFQLLDGKKLAAKIINHLQAEIKLLSRQPRLLVFLVGADYGSRIFVREKEKVARQVGIKFLLKKVNIPVTTSQVCALIAEEIKKNAPDGIVIQLPLPRGVDTKKVLCCIPSSQDVDGFSRAGALRSPVARGIVMLLSEYKIEIKGRRVVVVGAGRLVGQPVAKLFRAAGAKVLVCDVDTPCLASETLRADILIAGTGKPHLIGAEMVRKGAVVIDAGFQMEGGCIRGDVDFDAVKKKAAWITPVPGGVGPMTVAMLMFNLVELVKRHNL